MTTEELTGDLQRYGERIDREGLLPAHEPVNVGERERWLSLAAGGGLFLVGLCRRFPKGFYSMLFGGALAYRGWTGVCPLYRRLGLNTAVRHHGRIGVKAQHGVKIERTIHVDRDRDELYRFWRYQDNLPQVMTHLVSVRPTGPNRFHWVARGPMDRTLAWDAEVINERPGELIAWRSLPGSQVDTAGSVHFRRAPSGRGTEVTISLRYDPPGGRAAAELAHWLGQGLQEELADDLQLFKLKMERGSASPPVEEAAPTERPEP